LYVVDKTRDDQILSTMFGVRRDDDVKARWSHRSSSKRRQVMPACFGEKAAIKQSLMNTDRQKVGIEYRSSLLYRNTIPVHAAAAAAASDAVNSVSMCRQRSSVSKSQQVLYSSNESRMTSVMTVRRCQSTMTSDKRHHDTAVRHMTLCEDSGYEGTQCERTSSPAHQPLSRGSIHCLVCLTAGIT